MKTERRSILRNPRIESIHGRSIKRRAPPRLILSMASGLFQRERNVTGEGYAFRRTGTVDARWRWRGGQEWGGAEQRRARPKDPRSKRIRVPMFSAADLGTSPSLGFARAHRDYTDANRWRRGGGGKGSFLWGGVFFFSGEPEDNQKDKCDEPLV